MTRVMVDVERIISTYLRNVPAVVALVGDRVYTELPKSGGTFPLCRLARIGGGPTGTPAYMDVARLSVDVWGGSKFQARELTATIAAALDEAAGYSAHGGYIVGTSPGEVRYLPDETFTPTRPRYVVDVAVNTRPTV